MNYLVFGGLACVLLFLFRNDIRALLSRSSGAEPGTPRPAAPVDEIVAELLRAVQQQHAAQPQPANEPKSSEAAYRSIRDLEARMIELQLSPLDRHKALSPLLPCLLREIPDEMEPILEPEGKA